MMRQTPVPQLFVFDLDDTLMQTTIDYARARDALLRFAFEVFCSKDSRSLDEINDAMILEFRELDRTRSQTLDNGFIRFPGTCAEYYRILAARYQMAHDPLIEQKFLALGYEVFNPSHWAERGLIDDARELLTKLKQDGHHLMLCTRGDETVQTMKIKVLGLEEFFEDPDIFIVEKKTEERFQRMMAKFRMQHALISEYPTCWSIGDWYDADIAPALGAGFKGLLIQRDEQYQNPILEKSEIKIDRSRVTIVRDVSKITTLYQGGRLK
ncbi:HAD hydrolase-like protein [Patescibacteria group bacterium]|nr:HAD hydrolase-like protein [Patescibacteria group bacterium]